MVLDGLLVHLKTSLFILVHERSSSMLYVDGIGMVIIGLWSSKSTFGANNNVLRNDGTSKTRLNSGVLTMTQDVNLTQ